MEDGDGIDLGVLNFYTSVHGHKKLDLGWNGNQQSIRLISNGWVATSYWQGVAARADGGHVARKVAFETDIIA